MDGSKRSNWPEWMRAASQAWMGAKIFKRVRPPVDVDARGPQAEGFKFTDRGVQAIKDRRFAVVEKAVIDAATRVKREIGSRQRRRE